MKKYIFFLSLLLLLIILYFIKSTSRRNIDLVVARYNEDISWIKDIPGDYNVYIYNKGPDNKEFDSIKLDNLGREGHTYLTHVVNNYNNLAHVTFFTLGSAWHVNYKKSQLLKIAEHLKDNKTSAIIGHKDHIDAARDFSLDNYQVSNPDNLKLNPETNLKPSEDRPLGNWFDKRFPGESISGISYNGIFAATREDIQKRPVEFYNKLLEELNHVNPEVVHYFERVWANIFSIDNLLPPA
jgi:hypothetical protein